MIPKPDNPEHVRNLESISLLEEQDYVGPDVSLRESLFHYGLAWKDLGGELLFVHRTSHGKGFDRTTIKKDVDVHREWEWAFKGTKAVGAYRKLPLELKIRNLVFKHGVENIFGTTYWEGFQIKDE